MLKSLKKYIALCLFTLLLIPICSGSNVPSIAKGEYLSGWKYDGSGNLKADPSRGVTSIIYNAYNLPEQVVFKDGSRLYNYYFGDGEYAGSRESEKIITTVDGGSGTKVTTLTTTRKQIGNFVETNNSLNRIYIDEGYIDIFSGGAVDAEYHYYVKDYQGSVRAVVDEEGELKQSVDYTAYGVPSTRYMMNEDNRLHLGLEWQTLKSWNTYQNNARTRDPHYARFQQPDPLAEKYYPYSPYHYGINNPLKYVDNNGKDCKISVHGNKITITANVYVYNQNMTQQQLLDYSKIYLQNIYNNWGAITTYHDEISGTDFRLDWDINVEPGTPLYNNDEISELNFNGINNYMEISDQSSFVIGTNNGNIRGVNLESRNPMSHEFGHMLGLSDKYSKSTQTPLWNWRGNIMAEPAGKGVVEKKNLDILFKNLMLKLNPYLLPIPILYPDIELIYYIDNFEREKKGGEQLWIQGWK